MLEAHSLKMARLAYGKVLTCVVALPPQSIQCISLKAATRIVAV